ncbi:hypothetical protein F5883DRAFT_656400 [Diaporthe sp. PMI_573]|nr:hypothetical protein F5883DRAFT_656400 [Diaporthaceae sp. PMI_573]
MDQFAPFYDIQQGRMIGIWYQAILYLFGGTVDPAPARPLQANLGPFRYWIQETKREKIPLEDVRETLVTLHRGELPDLLRRHSAAASAFPR